MTYFPQIKTTPAELCAFSNVRSRADNDKVVPIIQLTKARVSSKSDSVTQFDSHMKRVFESLGQAKKLVLGITEDETYQDASLNHYIHDSSNGYYSWVKFVESIKANYNPNIIPSIVGKAHPATVADLKLQIQNLLSISDTISLRLPAGLNSDFSKVEEIFDALDLSRYSNRVLTVFDFKHVQRWQYIEGKVIELNAYLQSSALSTQNVILFSSCPSIFTIFGRENDPIEEFDMAEYHGLTVLQHLSALNYGDYAFIHPERNEGGGFWLPRVDYPSADSKCYYARAFNKQAKRSPGGRLTIETLYSNEVAYRSLCNSISMQSFCTTDTVESWGRSTILSNADDRNELSGKAPQHYIAIRSNIHMERVLALLSDT